jgi:cobalt/nickel transport system ATP-binding protein
MLQINNLCVKYSDGNQGIKDLSFRINKGETIGVVGANGAGKSTLLKSMVGLLPISNGSIQIDNIEVNKKNLKEIRERVGIVFQNPDDQLFLSNVYDDIAFGPRNKGVDEETISHDISNIVELLGTSHLLSKHSSRLSGGEKRVIAIATVLVMNPSIILFDEPSSFLDPKTRRKLMELLDQLEVTKLIATHDLDMALEICDRVIVLKEGKLFAEGAAYDILSNEVLLKEAGLELPFCMQSVRLKR